MKNQQEGGRDTMGGETREAVIKYGFFDGASQTLSHDYEKEG
jgi:hypothetical protein